MPLVPSSAVLVLWWSGCAGWPRSEVDGLSVDGLRVELGGGFTELGAEGLEAALAEARAAAPLQTHELAAAQRGPRGAAGLVRLQRSVEADAARYGPTVGAVLDALEADLRAQSGEAATLEARDRDGGRELCARLDADGAVRRSCVLVSVTADRGLLVRGVTCAAPSPEICERPLASRRYTGGGIPADVVLVAPGDLPRGGTGVWGFTLGSSRARFRASCREAGLPVDAYDWAVEPAVVREWFDAGRTSRCGGLPVDPAIGAASAASAVFEDDRLVGLTVFLDVAARRVGGALAERYPLSVEGQDQVLHVVDAEAEGDRLQSVTLFGEGAEPARITFLSERGSRSR